MEPVIVDQIECFPSLNLVAKTGAAQERQGFVLIFCARLFVMWIQEYNEIC